MDTTKSLPLLRVVVRISRLVEPLEISNQGVSVTRADSWTDAPAAPRPTKVTVESSFAKPEHRTASSGSPSSSREIIQVMTKVASVTGNPNVTGKRDRDWKSITWPNLNLKRFPTSAWSQSKMSLFSSSWPQPPASKLMEKGRSSRIADRIQFDFWL